MCSTRAVEGIKHMMFVEADYLKWLRGVVLFVLRMGLCGVFVCGHRTEKRGRVPREMTQLAVSCSSAFGGSVWSVVTS